MLKNGTVIEFAKLANKLRSEMQLNCDPAKEERFLSSVDWKGAYFITRDGSLQVRKLNPKYGGSVFCPLNNRSTVPA